MNQHFPDRLSAIKNFRGSIYQACVVCRVYTDFYFESLSVMTDGKSYRQNVSIFAYVCSLLGFSVDGGYDSSGWGSDLLLGLLSQVLADIGGGVGAFQFGLFPLSLTVGIWLSWSWWLLFDCWRCGGWGLWNSDLRRVQVDTVGWGMVVSVGPRHCVKELGRHKEMIFSLKIPLQYEMTQNISCLNICYLHPAIWKAWYTPTHLLTPCSGQGLPLWNKHT